MFFFHMLGCSFRRVRIEMSISKLYRSFYSTDVAGERFRVRKRKPSGWGEWREVVHLAEKWTVVKVHISQQCNENHNKFTSLWKFMYIKWPFTEVRIKEKTNDVVEFLFTSFLVLFQPKSVGCSETTTNTMHLFMMQQISS